MIALLCSVPMESEMLRASIQNAECLTIGSKAFFLGSESGRQVALCAGGMGKANAAHAASLLLTQFSPEALLIFGVGGAYAASGANVGDVALATEEVAGDEGVITVDGFRDTEYIGIPLIQKDNKNFFNTVPAPEFLLSQARQALARADGPGRHHAGTFVTLSTATGTNARALELEQRHRGLCENMEGAAAAQVAVMHGVPWLEVRGISNIVEDRDLGKWDLPLAAEAVQQAVRAILLNWND